MIAYNRRSWLDHLFAWKGSTLPNLLPRLILITLVAMGIHLLHSEGLARLALPTTFHTLLGLALSLLVAFRTNTAYDRFWEGRKAWGAIVNRSRNLVRQSQQTVADPAFARRIAQLVIVFIHAAKRHLWDDRDTPELERLVEAEEAAWLREAPGPAQRALLALGTEIQKARREGTIDGLDQQRLEGDVTMLMDQLGVCQRIKRTPIPLAYVLHLRRLLLIYCLSLPCALLDQKDWRDVLIVVMVSYGLLGIEQIGVEIEDPFEHTPNDLDLEAICGTIERDVRALSGLEK